MYLLKLGRFKFISKEKNYGNTNITTTIRGIWL